MLGLAVLFYLWFASVGSGFPTEPEPVIRFGIGLLAVVVCLICFVPAAVAMLFWGGKTGRGTARDMLDRALPLLTLAAILSPVWLTALV